MQAAHIKNLKKKIIFKKLIYVELRKKNHRWIIPASLKIKHTQYHLK